MAKGINPDIAVAFVLAEDKNLPATEQSRFYIKPLPADIQYELDDALSMSGNFQGADPAKPESANAQTVHIYPGRRERTTLLSGLVRIENYKVPKKAKGGEVREIDLDWGKDGKEHVDALNYIAPKHRREVADAIRDISTLSEQEEKKSDVPLSLASTSTTVQP